MRREYAAKPETHAPQFGVYEDMPPSHFGSGSAGLGWCQYTCEDDHES